MKQYTEAEYSRQEALAKTYRRFLDAGKTERECAANIVAIAKEHGYRDLEEILQKKESLKAGDRVYAVNMHKSVILAEIGTAGFEKGMQIIGSHLDSPRLDIKQKPLYESSGMAYLDTHYYGGVKKYQWVATPMALHGTVVKANGETVKIVIGEDAEDPVIGVTDLLVHLSSAQLGKKGSVVVEGEALDVLVGLRPDKKETDEKKDAVKAYILKLLKEKYGMEEADFISAELEVVPAGKARNFGLDNSMIMAYGQDDRICAFCSLTAMLESGVSEKTKVCLFADKEEIGSVGATGMESRFFENTVAELMEAAGTYSELKLRRALKHSRMLSADVNAGYDPLYHDVFDKNNAAYLGKGAVISKYTGARGKSGSNDANAEYLGALRQAFDAKNVAYQTAELGKVDAGGGGTIAYILAAYGMEVVDLGVAILNMHAQYEVSAKADVYETVSCYRAFYEM